MYKKCKEYIKTLEKLYDMKKLAVYDKNNWQFEQWIYI